MAILQESPMVHVDMFSTILQPRRAYLPGTAFNRAIKASTLTRKELLVIIKQRKIDLDEGRASPTQDLLSRMPFSRDENGNFMSEAEIAKTMFQMMTPSQDTIVSVCTSIVKYLAELPEVYQRVYLGFGLGHKHCNFTKFWIVAILSGLTMNPRLEISGWNQLNGTSEAGGCGLRPFEWIACEFEALGCLFEDCGSEVRPLTGLEKILFASGLYTSKLNLGGATYFGQNGLPVVGHLGRQLSRLEETT
ncbi:hypothetical protein Vadar_023693 [Vaccinium darrowii]|uniref:Uncharacterized protein n=1 Tax=Vaccinium darrowii TaxID=229202 RepID=A0ACB7Y232_9ERIC|nr:hypothetical protein Vadar_023693 [Vaccinium darrowii]